MDTHNELTKKQKGELWILMELMIHRYLPMTTVEGPGNDFALGTRLFHSLCGCGIPWTWSKDNGSKVEIEQLFEEIKKSKHDNKIEGVHFWVVNHLIRLRA